MNELTKRRNFPSFRLNKNNKTLLLTFLIPLILAANCVIIRIYLEAEKVQCPPPPPLGGFSFELSDASPSLLALGGKLECASSQMEFFYRINGIAAFFLVCLSIVLPVIFYLRRSPVRLPKIFEAS